MEESIFGDYALIKAWKADTKGNLVFRRTSRNFNADMASASKCTIAEVEEIVEAGQINPDEVHVPGVFVDHVYLAPRSEKRIEKITTNKSSGGGK